MHGFRTFFFGTNDPLDIIGWHLAMLIIFISGMLYKHWLDKHK